MVARHVPPQCDGVRGPPRAAAHSPRLDAPAAALLHVGHVVSRHARHRAGVAGPSERAPLDHGITQPPFGLNSVITPNLFPGVSISADLGNGPGIQEVATFSVDVAGAAGGAFRVCGLDQLQQHLAGHRRAHRTLARHHARARAQGPADNRTNLRRNRRDHARHRETERGEGADAAGARRHDLVSHDRGHRAAFAAPTNSSRPAAARSASAASASTGGPAANSPSRSGNVGRPSRTW